MEDERETVLCIKVASQEVNESCSEMQVHDYRVTIYCFQGKDRVQTRKKQVAAQEWKRNKNIIK